MAQPGTNTPIVINGDANKAVLERSEAALFDADKVPDGWKVAPGERGRPTLYDNADKSDASIVAVYNRLNNELTVNKPDTLAANLEHFKAMPDTFRDDLIAQLSPAAVAATPFTFPNKRNDDPISLQSLKSGILYPTSKEDIFVSLQAPGTATQGGSIAIYGKAATGEIAELCAVDLTSEHGKPSEDRLREITRSRVKLAGYLKDTKIFEPEQTIAPDGQTTTGDSLSSGFSKQVVSAYQRSLTTQTRETSFANMQSGILYRTDKDDTFVAVEAGKEGGKTRYDMHVYRQSAPGDFTELYALNITGAQGEKSSLSSRTDAARALQGMHIYELGHTLSPAGKETTGKTIPDYVQEAYRQGTRLLEKEKAISFAELRSDIMYPTSQPGTYINIKLHDNTKPYDVKENNQYDVQLLRTHGLDETRNLETFSITPTSYAEMERMAQYLKNLAIYTPEKNVSEARQNTNGEALPSYVNQALHNGLVAINAGSTNPPLAPAKPTDGKERLTTLLLAHEGDRLLAGIASPGAEPVWFYFNKEKKQWDSVDPTSSTTMSKDAIIQAGDQEKVTKYLKAFEQQAGVSFKTPGSKEESIYNRIFTEKNTESLPVFDTQAEYLRNSFQRYSTETAPKKEDPAATHSDTPTFNASINGNVETKHELNMGKGAVAFAAIAGTALLGTVAVGVARSRTAAETQQANGQNPQEAPKQQESWVRKVAPLGVAAAAVAAAALWVARSNSPGSGGSQSR